MTRRAPPTIGGRQSWFAMTGPLAAILALAASGSCRSSTPKPSADEAADKRAFTDAIFDVLSAEREVYAQEVVYRLQDQEKVFKASEHWKDEKTLPLPAQMFRMGAERVRQRTKAFSYALLSLDPINKQNQPRTEVEKQGLTAVAEDGGNYYADETLGDVRYFTAVYPDKAVSEACATCHNNHPDSPRTDFKVGDVMGAIVIRVARP